MVAASGSMTFRLPSDLQAAFVAACKANDQSAAQVLRAAMRAYLETHAQPALPLEAVAKPKGRKRARSGPLRGS
jgi:hypothetical protein